MVGLAQEKQAQQGALFEESPPKATEVTGTVQRILYSRGIWGLVLLKRGNGQEFKAKGQILPLSLQSEVRLVGKWVDDDRRPGEQIFDAEEVEVAEISTRRGLIAKLSELDNVGRRRACCLVEEFGEDPKELLRILKEEPERVAEAIDGITLERAMWISMAVKSGWGSEISRDVGLLKVLPKWITNKALKRWPGPPMTEKNALDILYRDPYRLVELDGVGFKRADKAAQDVGIPLEDPRRHVAALEYLLDQVTRGDGHTWVTFEQAVAWARQEKIEGIRMDEFQRAADVGQEACHLEIDADDPDWMAPMRLAKSEEIITHQAYRLSQRVEAETFNLTAEYSLNEAQARAVELAQTHRLLILTGGPGTGKTYTLQAILRAMEYQFRRPDFRGWGTIALVAPTGKAARRMHEVTGRPAATCHYMLGYKYELDAFEYGPGNPFPASLIVCDEASMLDSRLAGQLFGAVPHDGRLILVGDVDQLPSVGPGKVLQDLIESKQVPVVRLEQVMRQAEDSAIVTNAHALIQGESIAVDNGTFKDFKFFEVGTQEIKKEERIATCQTLLWAHSIVRNQLGHALEDIQVLSPQKAGEIGVLELTRRLRQELNPPADHKAELEIPGQRRTVREGDRVIQTKNDYDLGVMNGQIGTVVEIIPPDLAQQGRHKGFVLVAFEGGEYVRYPGAQAKSLQLAYAITVHKSQGSEWPVVIIPVSTSHAKTLTRRLLYTAITRGKELVVLVGTQKALRYAQKNIQDAQRQTRLLKSLQEGL